MNSKVGIGQALLRGWRRRCPRCDGRDLFASYFRLRSACPSCALVTRREPGAMTGQMYVSATLTQLPAVALVVAVFLFTDWSLPVAMAVMLPMVIAICYWSLPRCMSIWVAVEYLTDRGNGESWTRDEV